MLYYIYCIWVKTENGVLRYYGHTENITVRKGKHVSDHKRWVAAGRPEKMGDVYATRSVLVLDHEDWRMDVVDKIECETKDEARNLEGKWILENECVNMCVAGRTQQEYYQEHKKELKEYQKQHYEENKAEIKEKNKQYREQNKAKISEQQKQYRQDHKDQIKEYQKQYREDHKEKKKQQDKQYRETHKEEQKEYKKQYYEQNKAEIAEKGKEKVTCDICGSLVRKDKRAEHHKTKKCLAAKLSQQNTNADDVIPSSP